MQRGLQLVKRLEPLGRNFCLICSRRGLYFRFCSVKVAASGNPLLLMKQEENARLRVLAVDYGSVRIGIAVSDELQMLAHPRAFVSAQPGARAVREIAKIIRNESVGKILVGLPLHLDGKEGAAARSARQLADALTRATGIEVEMVDERLTTVLAHGLLAGAGHRQRAQKNKIDSASAAVLLQSYLDGLCKE